ncbi:MAG: GGDEF domain-containing protein [Burkholderiaceae bacterium]|jgi:diguanylate cyclase (GGDEF)-like protein|nr:GGDEF domain-containing protein [Burkholderiaceae bacterium]
MAPDFDPRTIFLVAACTAALGCATFVALLPMHPRARDALRRFAAAMGVMSVALLLYAVRDALALPLAHVAPNLLACAGIALCVDATLRTFDRRQSTWSLALQGVALGAIWLALADDGNGLPRVLAFSGIHAAYGFAAVAVLQSSPAWGRQRYVRTLAVTFGVYGIAHLARGTLGLMGGSPASGATAPGLAQVLFILLFALMPIVLALVVQTILHARITGELRVRATTDELTGLHTRRHFFELARRRLSRPPAGRGVHHLLMIDLDHFKSVNDRFGHGVGDRALCHAARVLRASVRNCGLLSRYGGEEFCALISTRDQDEARRAIDALRESLQNTPLRVGQAVIPLTASVGAVPIVDAESLERVLVHADHCVYRAKSEGRNRVVRYGETLAEPVV